MTSPTDVNEALVQAAVDAMKADRWLSVAIITMSKHDVHRRAAEAAIDAVTPILQTQLQQRLEPLLDGATVALSKGCTCDYYYGTDECTGRSDCGTPLAWRLNPEHVRAAVTEAGK